MKQDNEGKSSPVPGPGCAFSTGLCSRLLSPLPLRVSHTFLLHHPVAAVRHTPPAPHLPAPPAALPHPPPGLTGTVQGTCFSVAFELAPLPPLGFQTCSSGSSVGLAHHLFPRWETRLPRGPLCPVPSSWDVPSLGSTASCMVLTPTSNSQLL